MPVKARATRNADELVTPAAGDVAARPPHPDTLPVRQRERRDRIVAAAIELLREREYESVQMRDVAEAAGVALATLYRYFSSKEHLYAAALVSWADDYGPRGRPAGTGTDPARGRLAGAATGSAADDGSDEDRLRALMRRAIRAFERSPQMFRAQMVIERSADPNARELYDTFAARNLAVLTSAMEHLDAPTSRAVVTTVNCVMANHLRAWAHGRCTIRDVDRAVSDTIDLIFGPSPA